MILNVISVSLIVRDLIALTETQLLPQTSDDNIKDHLNPFTIYRQDHTSHRFCSLAVCIKNHLHINDYKYFPCINAIKNVVVNNKYQSHITLLLLYRKHNSSIVQFVERLRFIINNHDIDIILGDFNINFFNDDEMKPLNDMMNSSNYTQVVQSPTFISSGSLLDHIYVKSLFLHKIIHSVIPVYYSDHDAIKIIIEN